MKITYNWLKSYVAFDDAPEELAKTLSMLGLEVDSVVKAGDDYDGIVVGEVLDRRKHENADSLYVCEVDVGKEQLAIVCGAPNIQTGQKVPVALVGSNLPGGLKITKTKIRGVHSHGMICSEMELGLAEHSDGIMVLANGSQSGQPFAEVLGEQDSILEIDVTPNRPDCFGLFGIAREIAAYAETSFTRPEVLIKADKKTIDDLFTIEILDSGKCPRFAARFIGDVHIKPSPRWLVERLQALGIRSINNVVDVTNYVMMETGHPMHAYDYDLLSDHKIIVKTASDGDQFITLDNVNHELTSDTLMICDGQKPVAIGGIMGGQNSEVSENTRNILLECAYFDPVNIRRSAKKLAMNTEASKRFERGVDPNGIPYAIKRAAQIISELTGGENASGVIDVYPQKIKPVTVRVRPERVCKVLGLKIASTRIAALLRRLDFDVEKSEVLKVQIPTFRPDITREIDVIEEIARLQGYDNIPTESTAIIEQVVSREYDNEGLQSLSDFLISSGFSQVVTYSLQSRNMAGMFHQQGDLIELVNPLSEDLSTLRTSLLPGLLHAAKWNLNRSLRNIKIFETGTVFRKTAKAINENQCISGLMTGESSEQSWKKHTRILDIYDLKGYLTLLLRRHHIKQWQFEAAESPFTTLPTLKLTIDGRKAGVLGCIKPEILQSWDIDQPVYAFDFDLDVLLQGIGWKRKFESLVRFPAVKRDIAVIVEKTVDAGELIAAIFANGGEFLKKADVFDVFSSRQLGAGKKSVAFSLLFYSTARTLTEKEIEARIVVIMKALARQFSARLRD